MLLRCVLRDQGRTDRRLQLRIVGHSRVSSWKLPANVGHLQWHAVNYIPSASRNEPAKLCREETSEDKIQLRLVLGPLLSGDSFLH